MARLMVVFSSNVDITASLERIESQEDAIVDNHECQKGHVKIRLPDSKVWFEVCPKGKINVWVDNEEELATLLPRFKKVLVPSNEPLKLERLHSSEYKRPDIRLRTIEELEGVLNTVKEQRTSFSAFGSNYLVERS